MKAAHIQLQVGGTSVVQTSGLMMRRCCRIWRVKFAVALEGEAPPRDGIAERSGVHLCPFLENSVSRFLAINATPNSCFSAIILWPVSISSAMQR